MNFELSALFARSLAKKRETFRFLAPGTSNLLHVLTQLESMIQIANSTLIFYFSNLGDPFDGRRLSLFESRVLRTMREIW